MSALGDYAKVVYSAYNSTTSAHGDNSCSSLGIDSLRPSLEPKAHVTSCADVCVWSIWPCYFRVSILDLPPQNHDYRLWNSACVSLLVGSHNIVSYLVQSSCESLCLTLFPCDAEPGISANSCFPCIRYKEGRLEDVVILAGRPKSWEQKSSS